MGVAVGFIGTKRGMTAEQLARVGTILRQLARWGKITAHQGDNTGADRDFGDLCRTLGRNKIVLVGHPPAKRRTRAYYPCDVVRPPAGFAERVRAIVDESEVLIACPAEAVAAGRKGTWGVVRYARKKGKQVIVVRPDGEPDA